MSVWSQGDRRRRVRLAPARPRPMSATPAAAPAASGAQGGICSNGDETTSGGAGSEGTDVGAGAATSVAMATGATVGMATVGAATGNCGETAGVDVGVGV